MPPCYTFEKLCIPNDGLSPCSQNNQPDCGQVAGWFWILTGVVALGLIAANVRGN